MSAPGRGWSSLLADWRYASSLSLSPVLGETDAPAPVRAKEWARERTKVRGLEPLLVVACIDPHPPPLPRQGEGTH